MADFTDWWFRRLEWWPEIGATLGVGVGVARGLIEGEGSVGLPAIAAIAGVLAVAFLAHWLTKRAYFDRHLEHFLAAQYAAFIVLFAIGSGITKDVVRNGFWSWPLFDIAFSLITGALVYWVVFVLERRSIRRQWEAEEPEDDE